MSTEGAKESFGQRSEDYASARPRYPRELFDWILTHVDRREAAWDCATGTGQAAMSLAGHFDAVHATDLRSEQIAAAVAHPRVRYSVAPAETTPFPDESFDLVTVAQALHWFDHPRFWSEVRRVSRSSGFFCAWGYAWFDVDDDVDTALVQPVRKLIAPYWAANNRILWDGYVDADIACPFERVRAPSFAIRVTWSITQLIAYLQTWSAFKLASADRVVDEALRRTFDDACARFPLHEPLAVTMPLSVVAARVHR